MADDAPLGDTPKPTLGQAIDQVVSALSAFKTADQQTILRAVYAHLNISAPAEPSTTRRGSEEAPQEERRAPSRPNEQEFDGMDIKTFKERKNPTSARQMACLVAYYLSEIATGEERKDFVTTNDIEKYFKQGRYPLPNKLEQLLIDSRAAGYFETQSRGEYKLTRVGHNLVAHQLPASGKG
jgi:hypothetical protein